MEAEPDIVPFTKTANFRENVAYRHSIGQFLKGISHIRMGIAGEKRGQYPECTDSQPMHCMDGKEKISRVFPADFGNMCKLPIPGESGKGLGCGGSEPDRFIDENAA
jgi:hypothetical protein